MAWYDDYNYPDHEGNEMVYKSKQEGAGGKWAVIEVAPDNYTQGYHDLWVQPKTNITYSI